MHLFHHLLRGPGIGALALCATALQAQTVYLLDESASSVSFHGRLASTPIEGQSSAVHGAMRMDGPAHRMIRGAIRVPIASLRTIPRLATRHVGSLLGAANHPDIVFMLDSASVDPLGRWVYHGRLNLRGRWRPVLFVGEATARDTSLIAVGRTNVDVRQWGLEAPRWSRGPLRMNPIISLSFSATFRRDRALGARLAPAAAPGTPDAGVTLLSRALPAGSMPDAP